MTVEKYKKAIDTYRKKMEQYEKDMQKHTEKLTDCVGKKAEFCEKEKKP